MVRAMRRALLTPTHTHHVDMREAEKAVMDEAARLTLLMKQERVRSEEWVPSNGSGPWKVDKGACGAEFSEQEVDEAFFPSLKLFKEPKAGKLLRRQETAERQGHCGSSAPSKDTLGKGSGLFLVNCEVETPPGTPTSDAASDAISDLNSTQLIMADLKRQRRMSAEDAAFRFYCPLPPCTNTYSTGNGLTYHAKNFHSAARKSGARGRSSKKSTKGRKRRMRGAVTRRGKKAPPTGKHASIPALASQPQHLPTPALQVEGRWKGDMKMEAQLLRSVVKLEPLDGLLRQAPLCVKAEPFDTHAWFNAEDPQPRQAWTNDFFNIKTSPPPLNLKNEPMEMSGDAFPLEPLNDAQLKELFHEIMGEPYEEQRESMPLFAKPQPLQAPGDPWISGVQMKSIKVETQSPLHGKKEIGTSLSGVKLMGAPPPKRPTPMALSQRPAHAPFPPKLLIPRAMVTSYNWRNLGVVRAMHDHNYAVTPLSTPMTLQPFGRPQFVHVKALHLPSAFAKVSVLPIHVSQPHSFFGAMRGGPLELTFGDLSGAHSHIPTNPTPAHQDQQYRFKQFFN